MDRYTVKQLSDLAGVSVRTLHYYDEIGLLAPAQVGANGYRYYDDAALYRLQQILFFRELDMTLKDIGHLLDSPAFDLHAALALHRRGLQDKIARLQRLVQTVDNTLLQLQGDLNMSKQDLFRDFTPEEEEAYRQEARATWGTAVVDASYERWNGYTAEQQAAIKAESKAIYADFAQAIPSGPESDETQVVVGRWHQHLRYYYEPSPARLRGLGQMYVDHPDFAGKFRALHPDLPEFMRDAITVYCDRLD